MTRIEKTPGVCGGRARIAGTRIPVWTIVAYAREGLSTDEILRVYPTLSRQDAEAALIYAVENPSEINCDLVQNKARVNRMLDR